MRIDHPAIMAADYTRYTRTQEAEQHRLMVEAGVEEQQQRSRQRIIKVITSGAKQIVNLILAG